MDPERWRKIEALYEAARVVDPARRVVVLEEGCGGDEALRRGVESLLLHDDKAGRFLEVPCPGNVAGPSPLRRKGSGTHRSLSTRLVRKGKLLGCTRCHETPIEAEECSIWVRAHRADASAGVAGVQVTPTSRPGTRPSEDVPAPVPCLSRGVHLPRVVSAITSHLRPARSFLRRRRNVRDVT